LGYSRISTTCIFETIRKQVPHWFLEDPRKIVNPEPTRKLDLFALQFIEFPNLLPPHSPPPHHHHGQDRYHHL
jgi:hypothetical protein